jgi:hypothetical protein
MLIRISKNALKTPRNMLKLVILARFEKPQKIILIIYATRRETDSYKY